MFVVKDNFNFSYKINKIYSKEISENLNVSDICFNNKKEYVIEENILLMDSKGKHSTIIPKKSKDFLIVLDKNDYKIIDNKELNVADEIKLSEDFFSNKNYIKYIKISPNEETILLGTILKFEMKGIVNDSLDEDYLDRLYWVSSLDGLIGVGNGFNKMLSEGKHTITVTPVIGKDIIYNNYFFEVNVIRNFEDRIEIHEI